MLLNDILHTQTTSKTEYQKHELLLQIQSDACLAKVHRIYLIIQNQLINSSGLDTKTKPITISLIHSQQSVQCCYQGA